MQSWRKKNDIVALAQLRNLKQNQFYYLVKRNNYSTYPNKNVEMAAGVLRKIDC